MSNNELTAEESQLVNKMEKLGADFSNFFVVKTNLNKFFQLISLSIMKLQKLLSLLLNKLK